MLDRGQGRAGDERLARRACREHMSALPARPHTLRLTKISHTASESPCRPCRPREGSPLFPPLRSIHPIVRRLLWLPPVKQEVFDPVGLRSSAVFCQAFECGISEATGRYGDLRIRSKSPARATMLRDTDWFSWSRSVRSFCPFGSSPSRSPIHPALGRLGIVFMPPLPAPEPYNPRFLSSAPRLCAPSCWPVRSPRAFWVFSRSCAPAMKLPGSIFAPASSAETSRR
jgi:hypothetical protein